MSQGPEYEPQELPEEVTDAMAQAMQSFQNALNAAYAEVIQQFRQETASIGQETSAGLAEEKEQLTKVFAAEMRLNASQVPLYGTLVIEAEMAAGSLLTLPENINYIYNSGCLAVYREGLKQVKGIDYEEVEAAPATQIKLLKAAPADTVFDILVSPVNSAHQAELSASQAADAERQAAMHLMDARAACENLSVSMTQYRNDARMAAAKVATLADTATRSINDASAEAQDAEANAQGYADVAKRYSQLCQAAADDAYKYVALAANQSERTVIKALPSLQDLASQPPGFYIINENLSNPTQALGIYAATSIEEMNFDGIFYLAKQSDIPEAEKPPIYLPPAQSENSGNAESWLPCEHKH